MLVRRLRESDQDDVVDLSRGIYNGFDYLVAVFNDWLRDPHRVLLGVEVDGKLVGVECLTALDQGKTLIFQASRTHADYRGRGVSKALNYASSVAIPKFFTSAQRIRLSSAEAALFTRTLRARIPPQLHVGFLSCQFRVAGHLRPSFANLIDRRTKDISSLQRVSCDELCRLLFELRDGEAAARLAPGGLIMLNWVIHDLSSCNLRQFSKTAPEIQYWVARGEDDRLSSFSLGHRSPFEKGPEWVFAVVGDDTAGVGEHIDAHVAAGVDNECNGIMVMYPVSSRSHVRRHMDGVFSATGPHGVEPPPPPTNTALTDIPPDQQDAFEDMKRGGCHFNISGAVGWQFDGTSLPDFMSTPSSADTDNIVLQI